jgi:hypothetical protein
MCPRDGPRIRERVPISFTPTCESSGNILFYFIFYLYFNNFSKKEARINFFTSMQEGLEPCKEKVPRRLDLLYNTYYYI